MLPGSQPRAATARKLEEKPRDGYPDSIPMSNEKQMSHRLSRAVKIIKEQGKKYPEEKNRFCSAEASWAPPERARETAGGGPPRLSIASPPSTPQPPPPGEDVLCTAKKPAEVRTLRNNPSKGLILPCRVLNHWGATGGTPRQGLRAGAADPSTEGP